VRKILLTYRECDGFVIFVRMIVDFGEENSANSLG
jgi:hypothetical protein